MLSSEAGSTHRSKLSGLGLFGLLAVVVGLSSGTGIADAPTSRSNVYSAADTAPSHQEAPPSSQPEQGSDESEEDSFEECEVHTSPSFQSMDARGYEGDSSDYPPPVGLPQSGVHARVERPPALITVG